MKSIFRWVADRLGLRQTHFRRQLTFVVTGGMLVLAVSSSYATYTLTSQFLHHRLVEEGVQFARVFAGQSSLALLYHSPDNAIDAAEMTLSSPDVLGVGVYTPDGEPLLERGDIQQASGGVPGLAPDAVDRLEIDGKWFFTVPVYSGTGAEEGPESPFMSPAPEPQLLGFVRVAMSQQSLVAMATNILKSNVAASLVLAGLLLGVLLAVTHRLVKPLGDLAGLMKRAEDGGKLERAEIYGPKDIADMQHAFNSMVDALEAREEELVGARDMALQLARVKSQFAANVTHELRTPLNGIIGMLQLLEGTELDEEQRQRVGTAQSSAEALMSLINNILDFSKIDAGKAAPESRPFEIERLTGEVIDLLRNQAERKGIYLRCRIDQDVPPRLAGESTRIRQVLFNLVGNAIKFTREGGVELAVRLPEALRRYTDARGQILVEFSVIDTGIGISQEAQNQIFNPFSQADGSTSREFGGTGLGLTISQQLVEYMNGAIGVESTPGEGARFWFQVALQPATANDVSRSAPAGFIDPDEERPEPLREGLKVLIVDDNHTNQQVAKGMLENLGCTTRIVESGDEALRVVFSEHFDAVLMDVQMPGMDGYEVTDQIRRLEEGKSHIPVIAMSANNQQGDIDHCLAVGMDDYLPKPFKQHVLRRKLHLWTRRSADTDTRVRQATGEAPACAPETAAGQTGIPIDPKALEELRKNAGSAYLEMIEVYLEDQVLHLQAIARALEENDREALRRSAHTLKSASRHFGAGRLGELAQSIELAAKDLPLPSIVEKVKPLQDIASVVRQALGSELERLKSGSQVRDDAGEQGLARLLVVDDDRSMRVTMRAVLERDGYVLEECTNGAQAIKHCEHSPPDLVLMDAMMPGVDGFSACKALRNMPASRHVPVLIVTALDDENSIDQAFASGANDFIPKPVNFAVLRQRIARLLDASTAEKHVRHLAYHDTLTGLPNRRTFLEKLQQMCREPHDEHDMLAVLFLDLDRFKLVNDTLGHDAGDALLKSVTKRLQDSLRGSDVVSRLGGDEFTVILDHMNSADIVARIARKLCDELAKPYQLNGQQVYVTTSIGIALYPNDSSDITALIKYADTAMFQAKELRNTYQFYEIGMETRVAKRMELETELRKALERDEFMLHYQPQTDAQTGEIVGMEALVRWRHPERGMVSPGDFIPLAEETGLIAPLGEWVLMHACLQLREWLDKGYPPLILAVNISSRQLDDPDFLEKVLGILQQTGVPPGYVELEITESAIMKNPESVIPALEELKKRGIGLAIDDFGTGHSSLNYLRRFPVDTLKIDRSFINDIPTDGGEAVLVDGIIALAKSLHLRVIAEGVETEQQQQYLKTRRCDWLQGFYMFKPVPADVFERNTFFKRRATNF